MENALQNVDAKTLEAMKQLGIDPTAIKAEPATKAGKSKEPVTSTKWRPRTEEQINAEKIPADNAILEFNEGQTYTATIIKSFVNWDEKMEKTFFKLTLKVDGLDNIGTVFVSFPSTNLKNRSMNGYLMEEMRFTNFVKNMFSEESNKEFNESGKIWDMGQLIGQRTTFECVRSYVSQKGKRFDTLDNWNLLEA